MALTCRLLSILPCSWGARVCRKERTACLSLSLKHCQKARPGLTVCSGQSEGRRRLGQQWLFLPCLWMVVQRRGSGCSPGANKAPQEIRSNQDLKGANISQERGQNLAHFCCFASVPMKNNGSHCQSSWDPRAFFWPPLARVSCSEALAAWPVTESPVGQREEYLPSKARGEALELLRALVSSSQAGRGMTCSITLLWPTWACLWLLFQWLGTSLLALLITVSHIEYFFLVSTLMTPQILVFVWLFSSPAPDFE